MPESRASSKYNRTSPRKMRRVVDLIRGQHVIEAERLLRFSGLGASRDIEKLLHSAVANAEHEQRVDVDALYVKKAFVDEGPTAKRFLPRAHGRATPLFKRTSHITIVVDERGSKEG